MLVCYLPIPRVIFALLFPSPSAVIVVAQTRGHIAGSCPPLLHYGKRLQFFLIYWLLLLQQYCCCCVYVHEQRGGCCCCVPGELLMRADSAVWTSTTINSQPHLQALRRSKRLKRQKDWLGGSNNKSHENSSVCVSWRSALFLCTHPWWICMYTLAVISQYIYIYRIFSFHLPVMCTYEWHPRPLRTFAEAQAAVSPPRRSPPCTRYLSFYVSVIHDCLQLILETVY